MDKSHHLIVIYFCLAAIAGLLIFVAQSTMNSPEQSGNWSCSNIDCAQTVNVDEWVRQNCVGEADQAVCKLSLNGAIQDVPLSSINLAYLSEQCEKYVCTQETYTRNSNYTIQYNTSSLILK